MALQETVDPVSAGADASLVVPLAALDRSMLALAGEDFEEVSVVGSALNLVLVWTGLRSITLGLRKGDQRSKRAQASGCIRWPVKPVLFAGRTDQFLSVL